MGKSYIVDANAIIDYIGNKLPQQAAEVMDRLVDEAFNTSIVVKIEVLGYNGDIVEMQKLTDFLALATIFYIDDKIADKTIELRKLYKKLKLGDALIAATALVNDFVIVSRNIKDFQFIDGIDCVNPHELL